MIPLEAWIKARALISGSKEPQVVVSSISAIGEEKTSKGDGLVKPAAALENASSVVASAAKPAAKRRR